MLYNDAKELYEKQYQYVNSLLNNAGIKDYLLLQIRLALNLKLMKLDRETASAVFGMNQLKHELLSYPDIYNKARHWLIIVTGGDNRMTHRMHLKEDIDDVEAENVEQAMVEGGGEVMADVTNLIMDKNFRMISKSIGNGTWDVICHCTNKEATLLCNIIREMFPNETDNGYLRLKRMSGFLQFP